MASKTLPPKTPSKRASVRLPLTIHCGKRALRELMTEQCRRPGGFATYYSGTPKQFAAAGFPERCLTASRRTKMRIAPGGDAFDSEVDAWLTPGAPRLELEIHWSDRGPGGCCHPALGEAARLTLLTVGGYFDSGDWQSREVPVDRFVEATERGFGDYHLASDRRFQYTPEFKRTLLNLKHRLYEELRRGEILPLGAQSEPQQDADSEAPGMDVERLVSATIRRARSASHD